ncbi:MAG: T9SS type A sorting domain-containing protein [Flavobacteriales bacterium]|nr:T9SS type A sorting domain-containing protein [Flavobacteriales bacterium]
MTRHLLSPLLAILITTATAQVPTLLRDINPSGDSGADGIGCVNGLVYFRANDGTHGMEPWVSDGTTAGTRMLMDINPGSAGSLPSTFLGWQERVYFAADNGVNGYELWSTDGTTAGTVVELSIDNINDLESSNYFTVYNDMIVFQGQTEASGRELWISDGTVEGTVLLADLNPGALSSSPRHFAEYDGLLYFAANTPDIDEELWVTDGTTEGTHLVKDIDEGSGSGAPRDFAVANGLLFFKGDDGYAHGPELWATDGTTEGTYMVKDIIPGGNGSLPYGLVSFQDEVWFRAGNGTDLALFHSDGTAEGTVELTGSTPAISYPENLAAHGGHLYFSAFLNGSDQQLWSTDGTAAGTGPILQPGSTVNGPLYPTDGITSCGDYIFYLAQYDLGIGDEPYTLLNPTGLDEALMHQRGLLYPNPTEGRLNLNDAPAGATLQLTNLDGRLVLRAPVTDMDISAVANGLYLARIVARDGSVIHSERVMLAR